MDSFDTLGLKAELQEACSRLQWYNPTPIQSLVIPPALEGRNLVALAETGSGKTAAYALPILQKILDNPSTFFALVLAPTRELAAQVQTQFAALGKAFGLVALSLVGGIPITQQADQMQVSPPHILVATPGRLVDHLKRTKGFDEFKFANLRFLVIDEADRMLGSDFDSVLERILCVLPTTRQTLMFSATMTEKVAKLQRASIRDPLFFSTRKSKFQAVENLRQYVHLVPQSDLDTYLVYLLRVALCPDVVAPGLDAIRLTSTIPSGEEVKSVAPTSAIIFTRTRVASNRLSLLLRQFIPRNIIALNGDMPQAQRLGALYKFKKTHGAVLVATDVASRGLDIPQVGLVINYDIPLDAKTYMHRVGRTARAGRLGCSLTLLTQYSAVFFLKEIESHLLSSLGSQQHKIPCLVEPGSAEDKALEAMVAELSDQVKEAAALSNQALNALQKRSKRSEVVGRTKANSATASVKSTGDVTVLSGLRRSAWASEAPTVKREEIAKVLQAMKVDPTAESVSSESALHQTRKMKRRKFKRPTH